MVDNISNNKSSTIQDTSLLNVERQQNIEKSNLQSASKSNEDTITQLLDQAQISDAAKTAYENEKELLRFSRLAQRIKAPFDQQKVSEIKNLLDNGRINEYLRNLNTDALAEAILNSPSGNFLK